MAVLSKIRDRSLFLILIIGMALFAFVASPKDIVSFFKSDKTNYVGNINGEDISREEFSTQIKAYKDQSSNINDSQATKAVWDNLLSEKIYSSQLKKAGIVVGEKDIWEALINDNSIKNSPQFQNEAGLFDEESLKAYIADLQEDSSPDGKTRWASWIGYERSLKQNLERNAYLNLVKSGIDVSLEEGKRSYELNNLTVSGDYVFLPFFKVPDSTINVSDSDVEKYIKAHKNDFQVKASRSVQYVKFDLSPTIADKDVIKNELTDLIEDKEEYSKVIKDSLVRVGLKNTSDYTAFMAEYSDTPFVDEYVFKNKLDPKIADTLFALSSGEIYGPYEDNGYYKLSKIVESTEVPSVNASHILVAFEGAMRANPEIKRTKEEAEAKAQEILKKVNRSGVDFAAEAKVSSDGPSATKGGDLGWFKEGQMTPKFNDWVFANKKGNIGLVETEFGFHVIKVDDTKAEKGLKLATLSKIIVPSEETENAIFVEAETFAANISKGKNFTELAEEKNYSIKNAQKLKRRDYIVPGLTGNNPSIVYWTFEENSVVGNSKRFDIDKAYVVAQIIQKEEEGLQSVESATKIVKPKVIAEKKTAILTKSLEDGSLEEIATREEVRVQKTGETSFNNPGTSSLGREKAVLGTLLAMNEGDVIKGVKGSSGVYALKLTKKTIPAALESYEPYRIQLEKKLRKDNNSIYNALKDASEIEDYRN